MKRNRNQPTLLKLALILLLVTNNNFRTLTVPVSLNVLYMILKPENWDEIAFVTPTWNNAFIISELNLN